MTTIIVVDLYQTPPSRNPLRTRQQRWRWRARNTGNNHILAISSEPYTNKNDCLHAITQLFGTNTTIHLRDGDTPTHQLRTGTPA
jgi:uncharacterized protein YegP (UPF0339 family)